MPSIREWWRSLPPEYKELAFLGVHSSILAYIIWAFRSKGVRAIDLIRRSPGLFALGTIAGSIYYSLLKRFVIGEG